MPWKRYTVRRKLTDRQPTEKSQLPWLQREVDPLIKEIRLVLNWCAKYVGLVQVDDDQTPVDLTTSLAAGAHIAITKTGASPTKKLTISATGLPTGFPGYYEDDPLPDGNADPGDDPLVSHGDHVHPDAFPGYYEDNPEPDGVANPGDDARVSHGNHVHPNGLGPPVAAMFLGYSSCGQNLFGTAWTEGPTGTWTWNTPGPLPAAWIGDVTPVQGMRLLAWNTGVYTDQLREAGPYILTAVGTNAYYDPNPPHDLIPATYATMTRSTDVLRQGLRFYVQGGTLHASQMWELQTANPIIADVTPQLWALWGGASGVSRHADLPDLATSGHPADVITAGRLHRNIGTATDVNGMVTMPSNASRARIAMSIPYFAGIDATGFTAGDDIMVMVTNGTLAAPIVIEDNVTCTAPFLPIRTSTRDGIPEPINLEGPSTCWFWLDTDCWRLSHPPVTYVVP